MIKEIQRIFNTPGSEVVLEVLGKKVDDIDEEVSLLHELKRIVLEFIRQIEQADCGEVYNHIVKWINHNGSFELDDHPEHRVMCHRIGCDEIQKVLGIAQQEIFVPIKIKGEG